MSAHTEASVLAEFASIYPDMPMDTRSMAAALADARNACDESLAEIELLGERLADTRAELAKLRPIVNAARRIEAATSSHGWGGPPYVVTLNATVPYGVQALYEFVSEMFHAVRAADADGTVEP